jgi:hypothetical protein
VIGLSIAAGSLAAAKPASARYLVSYSTELLGHPYCLGVKAGNMTPGSRLILWDCNEYNDQKWTDYSNNQDPYVQMWTGANPAPGPNVNTSRCIALYNDGSTKDTNPAIIWNCSANTPDQDWEKVPVRQDSAGKNCYYFQNLKAFNQTGGGIKVLSPSSFDKEAGIEIDTYIPGSPWQLWCEYDDNPPPPKK